MDDTSNRPHCPTGSARPEPPSQGGGYPAGTDALYGHTARALPWVGARPTRLPPLRTPNTGDRLDVAAQLAGKRILLIGTTGFVGKVALSMVLHRYPQIGRIYCLVRPGAGNTADQRFYKKVATSEVFDPLRDVHGEGYEEFLRTKIVAIAGDIGRPLCNFDDAQFEAFEADGGLDVVLNSAGLVSFMPSLESALRINSMGARNVLDVARRAKAKLVHVSTCYVAGNREGEQWEDQPIVGYFPRNDDLLDRDFDSAAEIVDCQRIIDQARDRSNDRAHISQFREKAAQSLRDQRRDPDDENDLKLGVARERKIWMNDVLTKLGMERAVHWGWTNTYTYTKSLGEQIILADTSVSSTIVRPAVVESAVRYPFPGWNEGFNTTAPLIYLVLKGHRNIPARGNIALDVIPVDFIAAGMWLATAAIIAGVHEPVYQLGASDVNPVSNKRLIELTSLAVRRNHLAKASRGENELTARVRARLEGKPVSWESFDLRSAPMVKRLADGMIKQIETRLPRWGAPRLEALAERATDELGKISKFTGQVTDLVEMFRPFTYDNDLTFRCDNIRALWARVTPEDQDRLLWAPHLLDWRHYWMDTHFVGLQKWTFDKLDEEFGPKPRSVYTYKELLELFEAATKLHKNRVAFRLLPRTIEGDEDDVLDDRSARFRARKVVETPSTEPVTYTYGRIAELAELGAMALRARGVARGDRVMLMSENRPEWGISYFAILLANAVVVPVDSGLSAGEVVNLAKAATARLVIMSDRVADRLCGDAGLGVPVLPLEAAAEQGVSQAPPWSPAHVAMTEFFGRQVEGGAAALAYDDVLAPELTDAQRAPLAPSEHKGDTLASLIFTSGTTGQPKGVMLTHKNLTSMASKLSGMFPLYRHDRLLSVLPLHHTLEFSAGFLMPMVHGASIDYLEEIEAESLSRALQDEGITGMVGVPALFQLLERKIYKRFTEAGPLVEKAFEVAVDLNRQLREALPWDVGVGRGLFFPIHRKLGGRMRLLISGGSALPPDTMRTFRGLGFDLYEGYGMTESSPVLTVGRPGDKNLPGSVGRALPGIDVKIDKPDGNGVGEVIAKGPNVMPGYYQNPDATAETIKGGWLHTGDLGRFDAEGNLFIVGRKKEMILGPSGENVYPDELEELYGDSPFIEELSIVGVPGEGGGETVAALVVPDYEPVGHEHLDRDRIREEVREHLRKIGKGLALHKRLKIVHLRDADLPKTSTRKVRRRDVIKEIERLEKAARGGAEIKKLAAASSSAAGTVGDGGWVYDLVAEVSQKPRGGIDAATRLDSLGFDSLMFTELVAALDGAGVVLPDPSELAGLELAGDVEKLVTRIGRDSRQARKLSKVVASKQADADDDSGDIKVPAPLVTAGRRILRDGIRAMYDHYLDTQVYGASNVPPFGGFIVACNHSSHLDTGLAKYALGEQSDALVALAAKDYFFEDPVRKMYFENFTNLVPMERHGSLRESLRIAAEVVQNGHVLLIFPEGTRSDTGVMSDFKPSLGYLAMAARCGILPMYLAGTYDAMPKGRYLPKRGARVEAYVGPFVTHEEVVALGAGKSRSEQYRSIAQSVESTIRRLAPRTYEWTLGASGIQPATPGRSSGPGEGEAQS